MYGVADYLLLHKRIKDFQGRPGYKNLVENVENIGTCETALTLSEYYGPGPVNGTVFSGTKFVVLLMGDFTSQIFGNLGTQIKAGSFCDVYRCTIQSFGGIILTEVSLANQPVVVHLISIHRSQ
jgi:hypothetical protein